MVNKDGPASRPCSPKPLPVRNIMFPSKDHREPVFQHELEGVEAPARDGRARCYCAPERSCCVAWQECASVVLEVAGPVREKAAKAGLDDCFAMPKA